MTLDMPFELRDCNDDPLGLKVTAFPVPGKIALWLEGANAADTSPGDTIGLEISASGSPPFFYIPGCATMTPQLGLRLRDAELVFFDGTLWQDDEMIVQGVGEKTGRRMGHMSCSGEAGVIAAFANMNVARKIFIHINNTNPLLLDDSPERRFAGEAGWKVAYDGMEIVL
jgi:pyrroloquinoline quinone biosynthesis protein B